VKKTLHNKGWFHFGNQTGSDGTLLHCNLSVITGSQYPGKVVDVPRSSPTPRVDHQPATEF
jgi:hypothetical protein